MNTPVLTPAEDFTELRPILRTRRLARFRMLDVACPDGHRLAQVLRAPSGLVVLAYGRIGDGRDGWGALAWDNLDARDMIRLQCRCRTINLPVGALTRGIRDGRKRIVWEP